MGVEILEGAANMRRIQAARARQYHALLHTSEQVHAKIGFERRDLTGDGAFGEKQFF